MKQKTSILYNNPPGKGQPDPPTAPQKAVGIDECVSLVSLRTRLCLKVTTLLFWPTFAILLCICASKIEKAFTQTVAETRMQLPFHWQQQGTKVLFNDRIEPVIWASFHKNSYWITDAGLVQAFGVELLSTQDPSFQPVKWFSNPIAEPLILRARKKGADRFLDITKLAQWARWEISTSGEILKIASPTAKIVGLRQGQHPWGDRLVLDLQGTAPFSTIQENKELIVKIDATVSPALIKAFKVQPLNRATSIKLTTTNNQVIIKAGLPEKSERPRVWSLPNPNRLIIDLRADSSIEKNILWTSGVWWRQQHLWLGNSRFPVVWLEIDPTHPNISLRPIGSNPSSQEGTAPLIQVALKSQASIAINGGFFNRNNQLPLGAIRRDNRWLSGPILNRGAIAWNDAGEFKIGRLSLGETAVTSTGVRLPILHLNSGYVQAGIARYTPEWGPSYTPMIDNEIVIGVRHKRIVSHQKTGKSGTAKIPIPSDGYLLTLRACATAIKSLPIGTHLLVESATIPEQFDRYPHILGGGPVLLQNRQIVLDAKAEKFSDAFAKQKATRSAIGLTPRGTILIAAIHKSGDRKGPTLKELAQLMQHLGAADALNLDGGSSTSLYLGGQLLNRHPRTAAPVHNGLGIFIHPN